MARIDTAGPEKPRRYADADLGPTWFSTKTEPESKPETDPEPNPATKEHPNGAAEPAAKPEAGPDTAAQSPGIPAVAAGNAGVVLNLDLTGLLNGLTPGEAVLSPPAPAPEQPALPQRTGARRAAATGSPGGDTDSRVAGQAIGGKTTVAPSLMPGPEPTEPKPAGSSPEPLSAADLEAIRWRLDGATLREVVDDRDALRELGVRLDEPLSQDADNVTRSGLLSVRAEVYRLLGELGLAAAASRLALAHAEAAGDRQSIIIAQAELAHVLRLRGDFVEADRLFEEAASSESPDWLRSVVHENAGRSCFDQGRNMEALDHFARAIRLGPPADTDLVERIDVCLEAVYIHILRDGWGPYPRLRSDILGPGRAGARQQPA